MPEALTRHNGPCTVSRYHRLMFVAAVPSTHWFFLHGQASEMRRRGFEVHLVSSPGALLHRAAFREGAIAHPIPISRQLSPFADFVTTWRLWRLFRRVRPEVVHLSTPKAAFLGALAATLARVPVRVFLARGTITHAPRGLGPKANRLIERITVRLCHQTVAVSHSLLAFLRQQGVCRRHEGVVIANGMSNGVDVERFTNRNSFLGGDAEHPTIGFIGRLGIEKGIRELAAAWKIVRSLSPAYRLLVVGDWDIAAGVDDLIRRELEADTRVEFAGQVEDVRPFVERMRVLAFPTHREGFPNAPMEAAAMCVPCVGSRAVGMVDAVVDGVTGMLVDTSNAQEFAGALTQYLEDPDLARAHGANGSARVKQRFLRQPIWEGMASLYCQLLTRRYAQRQQLPSPINVAA